MKNWEVPQVCDAEESWEKLQARLSGEQSPMEVKVVHLRRNLWMAAASIAVLFAAFFYLSREQEHFIIAEGISQVELPDGSMAWLTSGSKLVWKNDFDDARDLQLDGEAFFEVQKGSAFTVETHKGEVQVLGTSFTVFAADDELHVDCHSGKVKVESEGAKAVIAEGQAVKTRAGKMSEPFEHTQKRPSWLLEGEIEYTNARLDRVLKHLMQRYEIEVRFDSEIGRKEFSGSFPDQGAKSSLSLIALAMGLELEEVAENSYLLR